MEDILADMMSSMHREMIMLSQSHDEHSEMKLTDRANEVKFIQETDELELEENEVQHSEHIHDEFSSLEDAYNKCEVNDPLAGELNLETDQQINMEQISQTYNPLTDNPHTLRAIKIPEVSKVQSERKSSELKDNTCSKIRNGTDNVNEVRQNVTQQHKNLQLSHSNNSVEETSANKEVNNNLVTCNCFQEELAFSKKRQCNCVIPCPTELGTSYTKDICSDKLCTTETIIPDLSWNAGTTNKQSESHNHTESDHTTNTPSANDTPSDYDDVQNTKTMSKVQESCCAKNQVDVAVKPAPDSVEMATVQNAKPSFLRLVNFNVIMKNQKQRPSLTPIPEAITSPIFQNAKGKAGELNMDSNGAASNAEESASSSKQMEDNATDTVKNEVDVTSNSGDLVSTGKESVSDDGLSRKVDAASGNVDEASLNVDSVSSNVAAESSDASTQTNRETERAYTKTPVIAHTKTEKETLDEQSIKLQTFTNIGTTTIIPDTIIPQASEFRRISEESEGDDISGNDTVNRDKLQGNSESTKEKPRTRRVGVCHGRQGLHVQRASTTDVPNFPRPRHSNTDTPPQLPPRRYSTNATPLSPFTRRSIATPTQSPTLRHHRFTTADAPRKLPRRTSIFEASKLLGHRWSTSDTPTLLENRVISARSRASTFHESRSASTLHDSCSDVAHETARTLGYSASTSELPKLPPRDCISISNIYKSKPKPGDSNPKSLGHRISVSKLAGHPTGERIIDTAAPELDIHEASDQWTSKRTSAISVALQWIQTQLLVMRYEDEELARTLFDLHKGIREVKLQRCCDSNRQALDDALDNMEDSSSLDLLTDWVPEALCPVLREIGITKMNIKGRRFSVL